MVTAKARQPKVASHEKGKRETRADAIARQLRDEILDGRRDPGAPLRQQEIADSLGASRVPVREALRLLEAEGFVTIHPFSGARVATLDFEDCLAIYKIRERLEPLAFSESMMNLTPHELSLVEMAAEVVEGTTADTGKWLAADRDFHLACYAGVRSTRLVGMITGFWNSTQMYRRVLLTTFSSEDFQIAHIEHRLMIEALSTQRARAGEDLLRSALERSRMRLSAHRHLFDR